MRSIIGMLERGDLAHELTQELSRAGDARADARAASRGGGVPDRGACAARCGDCPARPADRGIRARELRRTGNGEDDLRVE